jgi:hypothetical protein
MKDVHTGMMITSQEYDDFVGLIAGVLADNGVPEEQITECFAPALLAPALKNDIVGQ